MKRLLKIIIPLALLAVIIGWVITHPAILQPLILKYKSLTYKPCSQPVTYRINAIDSRFKITNQQAVDILKQAEAIWEKPTNKNLFEYATNGEVAISLIYDYRQEAADKLKSLGIKLEDSRASYDTLKAKYDAVLSEYNHKKATFDALYKQYQEKKTAYEAHVSEWNASDHTNKKEYSQLQQERSNLEALRLKAQAAQNSLNETVDIYNAIAHTLNQISSHLNLTVDQYNTIGREQGKEFNEGLYESDATGKRITIFEFQDQQQLIRVLAHEMGHALGLDHSEDPSDIMYRLNESKNEKLTANDLAAVQAVCNK